MCGYLRHSRDKKLEGSPLVELLTVAIFHRYCSKNEENSRDHLLLTSPPTFPIVYCRIVSNGPTFLPLYCGAVRRYKSTIFLSVIAPLVPVLSFSNLIHRHHCHRHPFHIRLSYGALWPCCFRAIKTTITVFLIRSVKPFRAPLRLRFNGMRGY